MKTPSAHQVNCNLFIDGALCPASGGRAFDAVNPSTGEVFAQVADASADDMCAAIAAARRAFDTGTWSRLTVRERGKYLQKIAQLIREHAHELASLETRDVGKTTKQSTFIDVPTCADTFDYFGSLIHQLDEHVNDVDAPVKSVTAFEPVGVVGCIVPWNYPLVIGAWKIAPALAAGNTVILKPSSSASASLMKLGELIAASGIPAGVMNIVSSARHEVASLLARSGDVDMISFTGGTETGKSIMAMAAGSAKKISLELGGKSPNIVFADCDFDAAVGGSLAAIFMNQGQMCTAGSRLLLQDSIYDRFLDALVSRAKKLIIGNAAEYTTDIGPLISKQHRDTVLAHINAGLAEGARLACGGAIPHGEQYKNGFYIEPTIFADVDNAMAIARQEVFGPVLSVIKFSSPDEAVCIANDSAYGLASCIWTKDLAKANTVAKRLRTGIVWVNTYGGFYNAASFGGYKESGSGRALGLEGLREYTHSKHLCVDQTPGGVPLAASWF